jgi:hypothetical protein
VGHVTKQPMLGAHEVRVGGEMPRAKLVKAV